MHLSGLAWDTRVPSLLGIQTDDYVYGAPIIFLFVFICVYL